ncbi:MAG: MAPEG family protein, partial [Myxococcales bacterium]|nr:MAPEG family protein [Myxococcales bacterium]
MGPLASPSLWSLLGFAGWTLLLVTVVLFYRTAIVFAGRRRADSWPRGTTPPDDPAWIVRVRDAPMNCAEPLPLFGAVGVVAVASAQLGASGPIAP